MALADDPDVAADPRSAVPVDGSAVGTRGRGDGLLAPDPAPKGRDDRPHSPTR